MEGTSRVSIYKEVSDLRRSLWRFIKCIGSVEILRKRLVSHFDLVCRQLAKVSLLVDDCDRTVDFPIVQGKGTRKSLSHRLPPTHCL